MSLSGARLRGVRIVELSALALLLVVVLSVYLGKAGAGRERSDIADIQTQIDDEHQRVELLKAEVAHLEQPGRLERLSETYLGMAPVSPKHEITPQGLAQAAQSAQVTPSGKASPAQPSAAQVASQTLDATPAPETVVR